MTYKLNNMENRRSKRRETMFEVMKYNQSHESTATERPTYVKQNLKNYT